MSCATGIPEWISGLSRDFPYFFDLLPSISGDDFKSRGLQLSDKALCFLDSGRHLLVVEFLHALPIAPPAPVNAAEIHSVPSKSTYYFNGIEREFTLLTQLESN